MNKFSGIVVKSESKRSYEEKTLVEILHVKNNGEDITRKFLIPGIHRIDVEEKIDVKYERYRCVNRVTEYSILNDSDTIKYTSEC